MHLLAISLLTILAGTLLLAKFKKENSGKFFVIISWFFVVVGFLLFIGFIAGGICKMTHKGCDGQPNCRHEMMLQKCDHGMPGMGCCHIGMGCCPEGMGKGMGCCPEGMGKEKCFPMHRCMSHDSTMKGCPGHMQGDSLKCPHQGK